jgi:hypothetical protein
MGGFSLLPLRQVIRPLLPKQRPSGGRPDEGPAELRSFPEAEKLMGEDARYVRAPPRDRRAAALLAYLGCHNQTPPFVAAVPSTSWEPPALGAARMLLE